MVAIGLAVEFAADSQPFLCKHRPAENCQIHHLQTVCGSISPLLVTKLLCALVAPNRNGITASLANKLGNVAGTNSWFHAGLCLGPGFRASDIFFVRFSSLLGTSFCPLRWSNMNRAHFVIASWLFLLMFSVLIYNKALKIWSQTQYGRSWKRCQEITHLQPMALFCMVLITHKMVKFHLGTVVVQSNQLPTWKNRLDNQV